MSEKSAANLTVLHLRFTLRVPPKFLLAHASEVATTIASVEGLIWKIWISDEAELAMGGVYLFATRSSAEAYLKSAAVQAVSTNPAVVSTASQLWDVYPGLSALTRAPLHGLPAHHSVPYPLLSGGR